MTIHLNYILKMFVIGQCADEDGEPILHGDKTPIMFISADLIINCGKTVASGFSIGHNGLPKNIDVYDDSYHDTKRSITDRLRMNVMGFDDFDNMEKLVDDKHITEATLNNIFKKLVIWKGWVCNDWFVERIPDEISRLGGGASIVHTDYYKRNRILCQR